MHQNSTNLTELQALQLYNNRVTSYHEIMQANFRDMSYTHCGVFDTHENTSSMSNHIPDADPGVRPATTVNIRYFLGLDLNYSKLRNFFLGKPVSAQAEELGTAVVTSLDDPDDGFPSIDYNARKRTTSGDSQVSTEILPFNPGGAVPVGPVRKRCSYIANIATECKIEIEGISIDSAANRLVAHRWIKRRMVQHGMRVRHIQQTLPLAVEAVFIPDQFEVEARQVRQSRAVLDRHHEYEQAIQPRNRPRIWNPFGFRQARPYPGAG